MPEMAAMPDITRKILFQLIDSDIAASAYAEAELPIYAVKLSRPDAVETLPVSLK